MVINYPSSVDDGKRFVDPILRSFSQKSLQKRPLYLWLIGKE